MMFSRLNHRPGSSEALRQSTRARLCFSSWLPPVLCAGALCGLLVSCGNKTEMATPPPAAETNVVAPPVASSVQLTNLVGRWERPDGGYILEIKSVDDGGKVDAAYFNPGPINVARAAAMRDKGTNKVFVVLSDQGYPGCTYSLAHDPQKDELYGQYFQAAMQETFEVVFTRVK